MTMCEAMRDPPRTERLPTIPYYDESTGLLLTYPDVFSSEGTLDENGKMNFYTL